MVNSTTSASGSATGGAISNLPNPNSVCARCREKGHDSKGCLANLLCVYCDKTTHISSSCTWLKQKKPVATFVGFGAAGLGCFVAEHSKNPPANDKGEAMALIRIKESSVDNVSADRLKFCLEKTYPWKWEWKVNKISADMFLVQFPSATKISEVSIYDCVPLHGASIMINVSKWSDELLATGKLSTVWVIARGIPRMLKNFQGFCEAGSTIGQVLEVDMELFKKTRQVRMKIGVVDHTKIPPSARVTTKELYFYDVRFELEEVVEEGWLSDENLMQTLDELEDIISDSANRGNKRQRNNSADAQVTLENEDRNIHASERTNKALQQRADSTREQDALDARALGHNTSRNLSQVLDNAAKAPIEETGQSLDVTANIQHQQVDSGGEPDKVQLSDDDDDETGNFLSQDSFAEKVGAYRGKGLAEALEKKTQTMQDD
jgi:hypothetical protein